MKKHVAPIIIASFATWIEKVNNIKEIADRRKVIHIINLYLFW
jgi:hypothetical protein